MKWFALLLCCMCIFTMRAQYDIKWSEPIRAKGRVDQLFPVSYSDFYSTRFLGNYLFGSTYLSWHNGFEIKNKAKLIPRLENGIGVYEGVAVIRQTPVMFISDKKDGMHLLYYQKLDVTCKAVGKPVLISSYTMPKSWKRRGDFRVEVSKDGSHLCVNYEIPGTRQKHDRYGYVVYNNEFEVKSKGEYELPYASDQVNISNRYLSNTGNYFLGVEVYKTDEDKRIFRNVSSLDKMVLLHVMPDGVEEFDLKLKDNKQISHMTLSSDNDHVITLTGLYGNDGVNGVFYYQFDFVKNDVVREGWNEFSKDFITEGWSDREIARANKRSEKGKGDPELYNYLVRDMLTLEDGSMIGMLEQFYIREVQNYNVQMRTYSTTYYYYFNDIIIYRIGQNGEFSWIKKIPKYQVSINDGGYMSSFATFVKNDKLVLMFNDHIRNYDDKGQYLNNTERLYPAAYRRNTNVVALAEVDFNSGEVSRKTFFDLAETKAYALPQKFVTDQVKKEMILMLRYGKKEKFGILSLD